MTEQDRLIRIENKLDKLIESNGQQNERIAVLETLAQNNQREIEELKKDINRRFSMVWRIFLGVGGILGTAGVLFILQMVDKI